MQRLRDQLDIDDAAVAELAALVRAVSDIEPGRDAEARVLQGLTERRRPVPVWWLRAAVVLVILVAVPLALAGLETRIRSDAATRTQSVERTAPALAPPQAASPVRSESPPPTRVPASEEHPAPAPKAHRSRLAADAPTPIERSTPDPLPEPATVVREADLDPALIRSDGTELVLEAMHALRRDHDTQSALRKLAAYRRRFPAGDLAEEALALSIEAFAALDDREALAAADDYVRRFPQGRFRELAEQAQRRFRSPQTRQEKSSTQPGGAPGRTSPRSDPAP